MLAPPSPLRRYFTCASAAAILISQSPGSAEAGGPTWAERYERARADLLDDRDERAERQLRQLAAEAKSEDDRRLAEEMAKLARDKRARREAPAPHLRTNDELTLLYSTAFIYGLGTSTWVALLTEPKSLGSAVLPFAALTTASVASVAWIDGTLPFRRGVPQSITAGLYLGLGEGVWAVGIQHARATRHDDDSHWEARSVATLLWSGATLGGAVGGVLGALREPTPGRVSFTASSSIWGGLFASFSAAALSASSNERTETALVAGAIGYNVGLASGVIFAPVIAPSVARVRLVDLGGIGGGLVGAGAYGLIAGDTAEAQGSLGSASIGLALGLGLTWWATDGMPSDPPRAHAQHTAFVPLLTPTEGGFLAQLSGAL